MVLFDRNWYNRAGVERVMGFWTEEEYPQGPPGRSFKTSWEFIIGHYPIHQ
jgi:polyphosphate kinase 2 (PPK2 family)